MRLLSQLLWLLIVASLIAFLWALFHGFSGTYCIHSAAQSGCGNNIRLTGRQVLVGAPLLVAVSLLLLRILDKITQR